MTDLKPAYYNHGEVEPFKLFDKYDEHNYYLRTALTYLSRPDKDPNAREQDLSKAYTCYRKYREVFPRRVSNLSKIEQADVDLIAERWKCNMRLFCEWAGAEDVKIEIAKGIKETLRNIRRWEEDWL